MTKTKASGVLAGAVSCSAAPVARKAARRARPTRLFGGFAGAGGAGLEPASL